MIAISWIKAHEQELKHATGAALKKKKKKLEIRHATCLVLNGGVYIVQCFITLIIFLSVKEGNRPLSYYED